MISVAENSNKCFKKTRFWKEKSVEEVVTLGPTAQGTLACMYEDKNFSSCLLPKSINARNPYYFQFPSRTSLIVQHCQIISPNCIELMCKDYA